MKQRAWRRVSVESELLAALEPTADRGMLDAALGQLSIADALELGSRLAEARAGDRVAAVFSTLSEERRRRIADHLDEARRRARTRGWL